MSVFRIVEKNTRYGVGFMSSKFEVKTPDSSKRHRLNQLKTSHGSHIVKNGSIKDCTWLYHIVTLPFDDQNHSFLHHSNPFISPSFLYHFPVLSSFSPWPWSCSIAGLPAQRVWTAQVIHFLRLRRGFTTSQTLVNQRMSGTVRILFLSKSIHMYNYILYIYIYLF